MFKNIIILVGCSILPSWVWAQSTENYALKSEDVVVFASIGPAESSQKLEGSKWADGGVSYGAQVMTFLTKYLGIGIEVMGNNFSEAVTSETWSERYWDPYVCPGGCSIQRNYSATDTIKTRVTNVMLAGRVNINPDERVRFYIPLGLGVAYTQMSIETLYTAGSTTEKLNLHSKENGFAWYLGGGMEVHVYKNLLLGIEGRYNQFELKITGIKETYRPHYFTGIAKIGYKF